MAASLEDTIEKFKSDEPPRGFALLRLATMPAVARNYIRDEAEFPASLDDLHQRLLAELEAIVSALDEVKDYPATAEELAQRRDNLDALRLEIEEIIPLEELQPEATPTPAVSKLGDRSKPVPPGEPFRFEHNGAQCAIVLEEVMRGQAAHEFRNKEESYTEYSAKEGLEYYLVRFTIAYLQGSEDESVSFDDGDFAIEVDNKLHGRTIATWDNALGGSMYPGGEITGWVVFQVPIGGEVQHVRFSPFLAGYEIWFSVPAE